MNKWQIQTKEFHAQFGCTIGRFPKMREPLLRYSLIDEECTELRDAVQTGDLISATDALGDILYVTLGTAVSWGIDMEQVFEAIHQSNMRKVGGDVRLDGKILKPPGWVPPDIDSILRAQGWREQMDIEGKK